ncbi:MAG: phospholipase [Candidatus Latescibacterota bacterium]|jgi:phospholipase/carboxylesterase|nr:phospholipase [Candidatus Latescibacterota bacterium]
MTDLALVTSEPRQSSSRSPLLVMLHGYGSHEQDLIGLVDFIDPRYRVVSVRAPLELDMGGFAWFPIEFSPVGMVMDMDEGLRSRDRLLSMLEQTQRQYGNDDSDTVTLGFSQGGAMALSMLLTAPGKLAGTAFLSGVWLRELLPDDAQSLTALEGKPVLQTHGLHDPLLPINKAHKTRDILESLPLDLTYREYPMGHEINGECLQDVSAWLAGRLPSG